MVLWSDSNDEGACIKLVTDREGAFHAYLFHNMAATWILALAERVNS